MTPAPSVTAATTPMTVPATTPAQRPEEDGLEDLCESWLDALSEVVLLAAVPGEEVSGEEVDILDDELEVLRFEETSFGTVLMD